MKYIYIYNSIYMQYSIALIKKYHRLDMYV